ncbi:putative adhesin [Streptomyces sp. NPDC029080]|uniref:putative adhesin n=1 Tax=Streptomyces sp. NPDC029080 TaxID=3155017 RepID=UPI0033FEE784
MRKHEHEELPEGTRTHGSRRAGSPADSPRSAPAAGPYDLTGYQRAYGNQLVGRMLADRTLSVQRMPGSSAQAQEEAEERTQDPNTTVLSGHGRFGDNQRLPKFPGTRSRALKATFTVPDGIELVVYAPPGAWLENEVAKLVESGNPPGADDLELVGADNKRKPMPAGYPKTFGVGEEVINYKLMPLDAKHLAEGATSVDTGTLSEKVNELAAAREQQAEDAPPLVVHYACCGVGSSSNPEIDKLFEHRNYTVMLRTTPRTPTPEPEPAKRRRKK